MISICETMRCRHCDDAGVCLRDARDRGRGLQHVPAVAYYPHLLMCELQYIGLGRVELEGNEPGPSRRIDGFAHEFRACPGAGTAEGVDEPIETGRQANLVLREVDATVKSRRDLASRKARQDERRGHCCMTPVSSPLRPSLRGREGPFGQGEPLIPAQRRCRLGTGIPGGGAKE